MNSKVLAIGVPLATAAMGAAAGYLFARKTLETKYDQRLAEELEASKEFYNALHKKGPYATPEDAFKARIPGATLTEEDKADVPEYEEPSVDLLESVVKGLRYMDAGTLMGQPKAPVTRNIFQGHVTDGEVERDPDDAYVITVEMFMEGDERFSQVTLTYWQEDDVLADENEMPIDDVDNIVGRANLEKFGHLSKDPNTVYIRNERIEVDYEVCLSKGSYAEEVHGITQERPRPRR
jgi:hypothetical protein